MNGEAVKELATRFQKPFEINGFIVRPDNWTAEDPLGLVKAGPSAATLKVSTLGTVRDRGRVYASAYGGKWFNPMRREPQHDSDKSAVFPNMKARQNVTFGQRSGVMVISLNGPEKGGA